MLLSDRGAFLTHIVLTDDLPGKRRMLAAVLESLQGGATTQSLPKTGCSTCKKVFLSTTCGS